MTTQLKPLDRTDKARASLHEALSIYRDTILPEAQNPERQILYWIDHSRDVLADEFRCFALQRRRVVIGYLQYSYFREEGIFFFEYLCIRDHARRGLVPSEILKSIEKHLGTTYPPSLMVFEVARHRNPAGEWEPDDRLLAYFTRLGFRQLAFKYRYPVLQSYDGEHSYPAELMVRLPGGRTTVSAFEMRTILRCIYFKHYLRWDRPFLDETRFRERERLINALYSDQVGQIAKDDSFGTSGDDTRSQRDIFSGHPRLAALLEKLFGPKLLRTHDRNRDPSRSAVGPG